ncbi:MAG TPA: hypothetical protein VG944_02180 [Fimbriimonas sp.]|nr:hypothetical protein [Fimbriimonas sp.]
MWLRFSSTSFCSPAISSRTPDTQAALAALDELAKSQGEHLRLPKAQMRQLLTILVMAAESEEQVNPEKVQFPDLEFPGDTYAKVFETLLSALYEDRELTIDRLPSL